MNPDSQSLSEQAATPDAPSVEPVLTEIEARILGSLVEKEATTPDTYPLTSNAIVLACNQKTAREPTMQLEPGEVGNVLRRLEVRGWVRSQHSGRTERYGHRVEKMLDLTRPQAALLALLMLRGPQTLHELLTRSERLCNFASIEDVQHALQRLGQREPPLVRHLPRQGGQREDRYAQLLSGDAGWTRASDASDEDDAPAPRGAQSTDRIAMLLERIEALEARIAALEA